MIMQISRIRMYITIYEYDVIPTYLMPNFCVTRRDSLWNAHFTYHGESSFSIFLQEMLWEWQIADREGPQNA
jgi:hypothetical protein